MTFSKTELEKMAQEKLQISLKWPAQKLLSLEKDNFKFEEMIDEKMVDFDIFVRRENDQGRFRLFVSAWDDGAGRSMSPPGASASFQLNWADMRFEK